tara:strand:- start:3798 stop:4079 length:282 start_codon:yes stop_codon:yes gene_type:complete
MCKLSQEKDSKTTKLALSQTQRKEQVMGRAIDMENDIIKLKKEVEEIKDVLQEILNEVKKDEKKKTNVKRSADSNRKSNSTDDESGGKNTESK